MPTCSRIASSSHRSTPLRYPPDGQVKTRLPAFHVLQQVKTMSHTERHTSKREPDIHKSIPSTSLGNIHLVEGRKKHLNIFVSLMFIHLPPRSTPRAGTHPPSTTPRRVLLDTGADFNLISYGAHAELGLSKRPYRERVHSIGGYTELNSVVVLQWHFRSQGSDPGQPPRPLRPDAVRIVPTTPVAAAT